MKAYDMDDNQRPPTSPGRPPDSDWTWITRDDLAAIARLHPRAVEIYLTLKLFSNADGQCWPGQDTLAQMIGVKRRVAMACIGRLEQAGYLNITLRNASHGRQTNLYTIQSPSTLNGIWATPHVRPEVHAHVPNGAIAHVRPEVQEQEPVLNKNQKNKNQSARAPSVVDPCLLDLIDQWNALGPSIVPAVRRDPPSKAVLACWKRTRTDPELREAFDDIPAIVAAARKAKGAHGKKWFDLGFLFTIDKERKEFRVHRLLNGAYDSVYGNSKQRVSSNRFDHDPDNPIADSL